MDIKEFRKHAHELVDWMADYLENVEQFPVKSQVKPGEIFNQLPDSPPQNSEPFENIMADFNKTIMPGMTHWQSPNFFGYFPANSSPPSILGEMLTSTLSAQCMIWQTSPAAAELEEKVLGWLKQMLDLPSDWSGVIQDTASSATLCAILTAREKQSNYSINKSGHTGQKFRLYGSSETHSSIEKAVKITGLGLDNLQKIDTDDKFALKPDALETAIKADIKAGFTPLCVIATMGTTSSTAIDPIEAIGEICKKYKIWLHVDAAFAGTALILPEMRWMSKGLELADSFVFNPHKWMFVNFDCSAYFVKDEEALVRTFEILPEYLKTNETERVNNYRDWGIALGRRFRALKLWFVIRSYGVDGLKEKIADHLTIAQNLSEQIKAHPDFEIVAPVPLNLICFRYCPTNINDETALDKMNQELLETLNNDGKLFLTHTKLNNQYILRMLIGQTYVKQHHVDTAWELIKQTAIEIRNKK